MPEKILKYIRPETFPTPFCAGCGHGILLGAILRAIDELGLNINKMVFASGIGCAAWIPSPHFNADTLHTTHGRPITFATGVKLFNPELKVVVISGDGDLASIGGNHLIHAARRNINIAVICANNSIYGMTGGQLASTTPTGGRTSTTPHGSQEAPFDLCRLVLGASPLGNYTPYVARGTVFHTRELIKYIKKAFTHQGFAFIDVISPCYTQFGRRNRYDSAAEMILDLKNICVRAKKPEDLFTFRSLGATLKGRSRSASGGEKNKILIGEFA